MPRLTADSLGERFWSKVEVGVCWEWTRAKINGYGVYQLDGRLRSAHRLAWEALVGPIAEGHVLDHLCRNAACIDPDHHRSVRQRVNALAGFGPSAVNAAKEYCAYGHEFTADNTYRYMKLGQMVRACRACNRRRTSEYRARKKELVSCG